MTPRKGVRASTTYSLKAFNNMMLNSKPSFHEIVSQALTVEAKSGYEIDPHEDRWELKGTWIDFATLDDVVTPDFKAELKQRFGALVGDRQLSDGMIGLCFTALRDCCRNTFNDNGALVAELSDQSIEKWRVAPSSNSYLINLKIFITHCRERDRTAFPGITNAVLQRLKSHQSHEYVITLNPKRGPWLQGEVTIQDTAVENVYTTGLWHPEKYVLVQLLRTFGMRIESLAFMKVADVRLPMLGDDVADVRWPFRKSELPVEKALRHALPDALRAAMEEYLHIRLSGVPREAWPNEPLFTATGLPGAFPLPPNPAKPPKPIKEGPYKGHPTAKVLGNRFVAAMKSLALMTRRTGKEEPMHFTTHRERHTVASRLALKGFSAAHIAAFLGHSSEESCTAYVDLAVMCFQLREPKFFHLLDDLGAAYSNPLVSQAEINKTFDIVISKEATLNTGALAVVGGGTCVGCAFAGASSDLEPWPCLSCPKFHIYEDADLQPLWDILQERKMALTNADGSWNSRFDPDILATLQRYETLLIGAEAHRRTHRGDSNRISEDVR